jgi:F-type H+-transporting ATPase subunit epsilon
MLRPYEFRDSLKTMADRITLRVVTPTRLVFDEEVDEVTAVGELGEFGVLPNHIDFLSTLVPGELSYKQGPKKQFIAIAGGYAEVLDNVMTVLATAAEFPWEIDVARAQGAKEQAEKILSEVNYEDQSFKPAEHALQRSLIRLQVASKEARR